MSTLLCTGRDIETRQLEPPSDASASSDSPGSCGLVSQFLGWSGLPAFWLGQAKRVAVCSARKQPSRSPNPLQKPKGRKTRPLRNAQKEQKSMKNNRKRSETLTVRLTENEKALIQKKAAKAKLSVTDFLVTASLQTEIHVTEDIKPVLIELKRIRQ